MRSTGTLTGTRCAAAVGRWPVETTVTDLEPALRPMGHPSDDEGCVVTVAVYVDNLYFAGRTMSDSVRMMRLVQNGLHTRWGLTLKPTSLQCLAPRGIAGAETWCDAEVPAVSRMECLMCCPRMGVPDRAGKPP